MKFISYCLMVLCLLSVSSVAAADERSVLLDTPEAWLNVTRPLVKQDFDNRFVLLDFWTYGCINCMQIVPDLDYLEHKFGEDLLVVGVHSAKFKGERGDERILAAAKRFGLNHPVLNDSRFKVWKQFGVRAWPTQVLLDPDGSEIARYVGEGHRSDIEGDLTKALRNVNIKAAPVPVSSFILKEKHDDVLSFPARLAYGADTPWGTLFFVADSGHNRIVGFSPDGKIAVIIGEGTKGNKDSAFDTAFFNNPRGVVYKDGALYVADTGNHTIRKIDLSSETVETVAGTGKQGRLRKAANKPALKTPIASPWDVAFLPDGRLAIAAAGTHQLWVYDPRKETLSVLAGSGREAITDSGEALKAALAQPSGLSLGGNDLFFVDAESSALRVLTAGGAVQTLVGTGLFDFGLRDGAYPDAMLQHPQGLYAADDKIYIADTYNNALRVYDRKTALLSTMALPEGLFLNEAGDVIMVNSALYITDTNNHRIVRYDPVAGGFAILLLKE